MATSRRAEVSWDGDLAKGSGRVSAATSRVFHDLGVSWASRTEAAGGKTSPEELLAAAHASCYAMALAAGLGRSGTPPSKLEVAATVTFEQKPDGWRVTKSELEVTGTVGNLEAGAFQQAAEAAKEGCPISQALKNNVQLSVKATLSA
jgi:osmotically inducible protein OsmC